MARRALDGCMLCALVLQRGGGWGSAGGEGTAAGAAVLRRERRGRAFRGQARMSGLGCGLCGKKTSRVVGRAGRRAIRGYVEKQATISLKTLGRLEWRHRVGAGRQQQTMVGGEARGAAGCTAQRGDSPRDCSVSRPCKEKSKHGRARAWKTAQHQRIAVVGSKDLLRTAEGVHRYGKKDGSTRPPPLNLSIDSDRAG